jgi:hypothetical protein
VANGESLAVILDRAFGISDPIDANNEPEPRRPLVFDCNSLSPVDGPA